MAITGREISGVDLLYGVAGKPARGGRSPEERARDLEAKFESFRQLMIRNTEGSHSGTDAADFLADFMHYSRENLPGASALSGLPKNNLHLYRTYMGFPDFQPGGSFSAYTYSEEMDEKHLDPDLPRLGQEYFTDSGEVRARRIKWEMESLNLNDEETMALFHIWCEKLGLDYDEVRQDAEQHFERES